MRESMVGLGSVIVAGGCVVSCFTSAGSAAGTDRGIEFVGGYEGVPRGAIRV